jgi:hypothetical protein
MDRYSPLLLLLILMLLLSQAETTKTYYGTGGDPVSYYMPKQELALFYAFHAVTLDSLAITASGKGSESFDVVLRAGTKLLFQTTVSTVNTRLLFPPTAFANRIIDRDSVLWLSSDKSKLQALLLEVFALGLKPNQFEVVADEIYDKKQ